MCASVVEKGFIHFYGSWSTSSDLNDQKQLSRITHNDDCSVLDHSVFTVPKMAALFTLWQRVDLLAKNIVKKVIFKKRSRICVVTWTRIFFIDNKPLRTLPSKELCLKFTKSHIKQTALILEALHMFVTVPDTKLFLLPLSNMSFAGNVHDKIIIRIFSFFLSGNSSVHKYARVGHTRCHQNM